MSLKIVNNTAGEMGFKPNNIIFTFFLRNIFTLDSSWSSNSK